MSAHRLPLEELEGGGWTMTYLTTSLLMDIGIASIFCTVREPPALSTQASPQEGAPSVGGVAGERLPLQRACVPLTHLSAPCLIPCSEFTEHFRSTILFLLTRALRGSDISTISQARTGIQPILSLSRAPAQLRPVQTRQVCTPQEW